MRCAGRGIQKEKGKIPNGHLNAIVIRDGLAIDAQPVSQLLRYSLAVEFFVGAQSGAEKAEGIVYRDTIPSGDRVNTGASHCVGQGGQTASVDDAVRVEALRMYREFPKSGAILIECSDADMIMDGKGIMDRREVPENGNGLIAGIH